MKNVYSTYYTYLCFIYIYYIYVHIHCILEYVYTHLSRSLSLSLSLLFCLILVSRHLSNTSSNTFLPQRHSTRSGNIRDNLSWFEPKHTGYACENCEKSETDLSQKGVNLNLRWPEILVYLVRIGRPHLIYQYLCLHYL